MDGFIKFTNQSQGRDRIFRATQYACALVKYLLRNKAARKELVKKLQALESNMSAGRKLFRLGSTVSSLQTARQTWRLSDPVLRACLTVASLSRALYFACDNLLWARSVGLVRDVDKESWRLAASRCYFVSLVMSLTRDAYVIARIVAHKSQDRDYQRKARQHLSEHQDVACTVIPQLDAFLFLLYESLKTNPPIVLDTAKNVCDLFIPLDRLGIYPTNAGVVGFCGLMSSLLGILSVLKPGLKVKP
ncbi:peroxisomal membrane protein 11A-like [Megalops cyprinoides]|uniref:peroxisomal membrane protein 11A-like n=1 Tax=Megalops cyprinoides TaxID=118141 RepID=UPI0018655B39|nr:peroxisomal membrane protein 11A-like [Megalops cyprinoides]